MIGLRVNNYEIVSVLGEGGMGTVYLAQHPVMGRKAAIKLLRRELAEDKTLVARFINEARAANAIRHPNIIDVIDVGTLSDGLPYMMMEFLDGESLAQRLAGARKLSVPEAISIASQTAGALAAAHDKGIVHRDLKPDNLFLVPDPGSAGPERVKVLDFGIAKLRGELGGGGVKTNAGSILGTPPYMSPEQCRGFNDDIDLRTDVYSLGIILFEMLCGTPPFKSDGYGELIIMHLMRAPAPPRQLNPAIPEALEKVILQALAKEPKDRFPSMRDFKAALGQALGPPLRTPVVVATQLYTTLSSVTGQMAVSTGDLATPPRRRRRMLVAGATGVVAVIAIGAIAALNRPQTIHRSSQPRAETAAGAVAPPPIAAPTPPPPPPPTPVPEVVAAPPAPEPVVPPTPVAEATRKPGARKVIKRSSPKSDAVSTAPATVAPAAAAAVAPPPERTPATPAPPPARPKTRAEKW